MRKLGLFLTAVVGVASGMVPATVAHAATVTVNLTCRQDVTFYASPGDTVVFNLGAECLDFWNVQSEGTAPDHVVVKEDTTGPGPFNFEETTGSMSVDYFWGGEIYDPKDWYAGGADDAVTTTLLDHYGDARPLAVGDKVAHLEYGSDKGYWLTYGGAPRGVRERAVADPQAGEVALLADQPCATHPTLTATPYGFTDVKSYRYAWQLNGAPIDGTDSTLTPKLARGDVVSVSIVGVNGEKSTPPVSAQITNCASPTISRGVLAHTGDSDGLSPLIGLGVLGIAFALSVAFIGSQLAQPGSPPMVFVAGLGLLVLAVVIKLHDLAAAWLPTKTD